MNRSTLVKLLGGLGIGLGLVSGVVEWFNTNLEIRETVDEAVSQKLKELKLLPDNSGKEDTKE